MNKDYFIQMLPSEIVFSVIDLLSFIVVIVAHKMNEMEGDVMYKKGDYVIKIPEGICKIEDIGYLDISHPNTHKKYYMLVPISEKSSKIYVPVDAAEKRIRTLISKEDAMKFIKLIPEIVEKDIPNEKLREQEYKTALLSGNQNQIVSVIKSIYTRKQERMEHGKKITATDDKYFKQAKDILYSELSFVLHIPKENMEQFILDTIEMQET